MSDDHAPVSVGPAEWEAWLGREVEQRSPDNGHPLLAPRCRCAEPAIVEDFYGERRCTFCGREPAQ